MISCPTQQIINNFHNKDIVQQRKGKAIMCNQIKTNSFWETRIDDIPLRYLLDISSAQSKFKRFITILDIFSEKRLRDLRIINFYKISKSGHEHAVVCDLHKRFKTLPKNVLGAN